MFSFFAAPIAVRRRGLVTGSPPPVRAAIVSSRIILVKTLPRLASVAAFLCLIVAHFECPDMSNLLWKVWQEPQINSCHVSLAAALKSGNRGPGIRHRRSLSQPRAALIFFSECKSAGGKIDKPGETHPEIRR